jgi:lipoprotein-anchoring transpeptidase ErfK/SrfK
VKSLTRLLLPVAAVCAVAFLPACTTLQPTETYTVKAFKPHNPNNVTVKVSISTQNIYVKEGDRLLMAVQGCVGENGRTPMGNHTIIAKDKFHRSGSFGFTAGGQPADIHKGQSVAVGYPMGYWCEFAPSYGFHEGFVWGIPRTHGCIRLHKEAAARFWQLVKVGTPVNIALHQPEDVQFGHFVRKLDQRNDPDPPTGLLMSQRWFQDPPGPLLIEQ